MNKIIRDYPVDQLPADLQDGLPEHGLVEIEFRLASEQRPAIKSASLVGTGPNVHGNMQEILNYIATIRADRDEIK